MRDEIRTPDGSYKKSADALREWGVLASPLVELGFEVHGFDPGISFRSQSAKNHMATFCISVDDLKIINKAIRPIN